MFNFILKLPLYFIRLSFPVIFLIIIVIMERRVMRQMNKASIGARIRAARNLLKLTQVEFAQRLNCSPQVLSSYERGIYVPDIFLLEAIVSITPGMTLDDFRDDNPPAEPDQASTASRELSSVEWQMVEKVRSMRRNRRKGLFLLLGIREQNKK